MNYPNNNDSSNMPNLHLCDSPQPLKEEMPVVRRVTLHDLPAILSIERASFSNPWSMTCFRSELQDNEAAHYFCLVHNGEIIGYVGYWAIFDEAHITNVAIIQPWRGKGLGEYLMGAIMLYCLKTGISRMTLEVRVSNVIAQRMYNKLGFAAVGIRPKYYSDNLEDAVVMWATL
jgi:ribosomal-protein-alanine N-acetyltransferase